MALERELTRVQSELDGLNAQRATLCGQATMSAVTLTLRQRRVLGPLGQVAKGAAWTIGKLFVLR